ncbi:hypothetical protein J2S70_000587 [Trueperella bonasi]|uniref:4-amino-4-deoxy-L-arabinose transferase-like glycosyltransferase n=1 Tax=Trueperella bonasi TaxID=312286 RepID=A0ABT9NF62_9ACTO|nr:DUF6541 family protein [Trueperella bonasi]MDP9806005.1 hypothetical protein [Trueperella bonasi]
MIIAGYALALLVLNVAPGYALARAVRIPRRIAVASAGALSLAVVGLLSNVYHFCAIAWTLGSFATGATSLVFFGVILSRLIPSFLPTDWQECAPPGRYRMFAYVVPLLAVAILVVPILMRVDLSLPSSQADPMYHYNALHAIGYHQDASMFGAMQANYGINTIPTNYPAVWHAVLALINPQAPALASHVFAYLVLPILWVGSITFLGRVVLGSAGVLTPLVAAVFPHFLTFLSLARGFWPNALAYAHIPAVLGIIVLAWRQIAGTEADWSRFGGYVTLVLVMVVGIGLTHPSAVFSVLWLLLPTALHVAYHAVRAGLSGTRRRVFIACLGFLVLALALCANPNVWGYIIREHPRNWDTTERIATLAAQLSVGPGVVWVLAIIVAVVTLAVTTLGTRALWPMGNMRWIIAGWCAQWLLVFGAYVNGNPFANLAGIWYHDPNRLLAVQTIPSAIILVALLSRLTRTIRATIVCSAALAVAAGGIQWGAFAAASQPPIGAGKMMTRADFEFFASLDDYVEPGAVVLGDPATGLGYAPLYSGVDVVFTQVNRTAADHDGTYLVTHVDDIAHDPHICRILARYGIEYFYQTEDFTFQKRQRSERWPGLYRVDASKGFTKVADTERGTLWKFTACLHPGQDLPPRIDWWDVVARRTPLSTEEIFAVKSAEWSCRIHGECE